MTSEALSALVMVASDSATKISMDKSLSFLIIASTTMGSVVAPVSHVLVVMKLTFMSAFL